MLPQQYCLKWKYHNTNIQFTFSQLLEKGSFCDVTLWCGGCAFRAHRAVLASCSGLLALLLDSHEAAGGEPALVLDRTEPQHLRQLLAFMYTGEVSVHHTELAGLLKTAEELKIKGLADVSWKDSNATNNTPNNATPNNATPSNATPNNATHNAANIDPPSSYASGQLQPNIIASNITAVAAAITAATKSNATPTPVGIPLVGPIITKVETITSSVGTDPLITDVEEVHPVQPIMLTVNGSLILPPLNLAQTPPPIEMVKRRRGRPPLEPKMPQDSEILTIEHSSPKKVKMESPQFSMVKKLPEECLVKELPIEWTRPPTSSIEEPEELSSDYSEASLDGRDISHFLDTVMEVDGAAPSSPSPVIHSSPQNAAQFKVDPLALTTASSLDKPASEAPAAPGPAAGGVPAQFADVVKLSDYLVRGRRPQFWAEDYVKRVMEAVFCKELEMKQAAEMLGVSYGTLYGRYRDCFGCINRPYRVQDFWTEQGRAEILIKLQMKDITLFKAAEMLNVTPQTLSSYLNTIDPNSSIKEEASTSPQSHEDKDNEGNGKTEKLLSPKYETDVNSDNDNEDEEEDGSSSKDGSIDSPKLNQSISPADESKIIASDPKSIMTKTPAIRVVNMKFLKGDTVEDAVSGEAISVSQLLKNHPDLTMTAATNKRKVHFQEETDIINPTSSNGDNEDDDDVEDVEDIDDVDDSSSSS